MEDLSYLQYFITEDIYIIPGDDFSHNEETKDLTRESTRSPDSLTVNQTTTDVVGSQDDVTRPEKPEPVEKQVNEVEQTTTEKQYVPPVYSGLFTKKVLVLIHSAGLNFEHKELLLKILGAIQLSKEDIAILPSGHLKSKDDFDWMLQVDKSILLAFGLPDKWKLQISNQIENYKIERIKGFQLLFSDNLSMVSNDVKVKQQLWKALQQLTVNE